MYEQYWGNFYKRAQLLGISAYSTIFILISILNPFNWLSHLLLLIVIIFLFYVQKIRGYIPQYFFKYIHTKIGGNIRNIRKYN